MLFFPLQTVVAREEGNTDAALQALLGALQQKTRIATRTRMNVGFVPGMVSVLYGKGFQDKGVRNVSEALVLIPGVENVVIRKQVKQAPVRHGSLGRTTSGAPWWFENRAQGWRLDLSFSGTNIDGDLVEASIKNMFDVDVQYPSPLVSFGGAVIPSYQDDYPRPGRKYWLQTGIEF